MKNLLKNAAYGALFIVSGIIFQISCSNSDDSAKAPVDIATPALTGKLIFLKADSSGSGFYTCNYDGSNQTQIPFTFPSNLSVTTTTLCPHLSPDGQKIFFVATDTTDNAQKVYSCNIDGTNFQEIVTNGPNGILELGNPN